MIIVCLLVMIAYRLGVWVKNDKDIDYIIFEWTFTLFNLLSFLII